VKDLEAETLTLRGEIAKITEQLDQAKEEEEKLSGMLWESQAEVAAKERGVMEVKETIKAM
jgi:predicted  nucleic acid-binding Zn-ribbon protein